MAKRNRGRRNGGQNGPRPEPNRSAASTSTSAGATSQTHTRLLTQILPHTSTAPDWSTARQVTEQPVPLHAQQPPGTSEPIAPGPTDIGGGFQLVTSRRHAARSRIQRRETQFSSDIQPLSMARNGDAYRRVNSYLEFLFERLHEAISDDRMDFGEILAEVNRLLGTRREASTVAESVTEDYAGSDENTDALDSRWMDDAPTDVSSPTLGISLDNEEHFPELGAHRARNNTHSGVHQLAWGAVFQTRSTPGSNQRTHTPPPTAVAVPPPRLWNPPVARPPPPPVPSVVTPNPPENLQKLAEDASLLLELYSKSLDKG